VKDTEPPTYPNKRHMMSPRTAYNTNPTVGTAEQSDAAQAKMDARERDKNPPLRRQRLRAQPSWIRRRP